MSSQLHQAIQLAQAGQREPARDLLRQVTQSDPNNEVAWQWLASVAADNAEYRYALEQVLRINPTNQQARDALAQLQQQQAYSAPPPQAPPTPQYGAPPPPQQQAYQSYQQPRHAPPPRYAQQAPYVQRRTGGCGGCWIALFLLVILPTLICGGLGYTGMSLGPLDTLATFFPSDLGRKTVEFDAGDYQISIDVPRSWYPAIKDETWWEFWSGALDVIIPLETSDDDDDDNEWKDSGVDADDVDEYGGLGIAETNPVMLALGGFPIGVSFDGISSASSLDTYSFDCADIRDMVDDVKGEIDSDEYENFESVSAGGSRCGVRLDRVAEFDEDTDRVFKNHDLPEKIRSVNFWVPIDDETATRWEVFVPETLYNFYKGDIEAMIESVEVKD